TSPLSPYICSLSIKITGSSSRIADFKSPLASYGLEGTTTFKPGVLANQLSKACECVAPNCPAEAVGPRNTIGHLNCPPDICRILAALFIIWSIPTSEKLKVIYSTMGRQPVMVDPMATPAKPSS